VTSDPSAATLVAPRFPPDEPERLAALREAAILDTPPEPEFDALTRFAAELCGTSMALVSLVDSDRQWFKARVGLDAPETPRSVSFCAHAIHDDALFEVEDAARDPRFADNPLVTGDPFIRFYAGSPLRTDDGHALGTICVLDRSPMQLTPAQRTGLAVLARQVMTQIVLRRGVRPSAVPPDAAAVTVDVHPDSVAATLQPVGARAARPVPPRFGRFHTLGVIGEGAMATVYAAYDHQLQRRIAVKLVHHTSDRDEQSRVRREALALARISHPNVVQIYEAGALADQTFIAMEFVQGVTLTLWQQARPRGIPELLAMYVQAGRGLVAAHAVGVVHRDFKPDNVLVGADGRPRVADFGLARLSGSEELAPGASLGVDVQATADGSLLGTPAYMSPEQYAGPRVDDRADQFSYCAALYEALYGVRPFAGRTFAEIRANLDRGALNEAPEGRRAAPGLHAALLRGLEREPAARWPSLAALVETLARYDPARDIAAAARERRGMSTALVGLMLAIGAVMLALSLGDPDFYDPVSLLAPVSALLVGIAVILRRMRARLLGNQFHRLVVDMMLTLVLTIFAGRLLAICAGLAPVHALMLGMLTGGAAAATLAAFVARFMAAVALLQLSSAVLLAADLGLVAAIDVTTQTVTALLFIRAWNLSATADHVRLEGRAVG
jgi:tRNA A-37 threonylcarbamoyl transferase component Bud32